MKHKITFITIIIYFLIIFALVSRNGDLMVMIVPLLIYLGVGVFFAPREMNLTAIRQADKRIDDSGKSVLVKVILTNKGECLKNVLLYDMQFPKTEILDGEYEQCLAIPAKGEATISYSFRTHRGLFFWETIRVFASDPFGLVGIQRDIQAPAEVLIQPEYEKLNHIPLKPNNTLHSTGLVPARRGGAGLIFWAVREYHLGDSLRWLNWKTIARHPRQMYTTEFEHEEIMDIGLILDARLQTEIQYGGESLFGYSVSAAMSLAELFLREGNRVGLLIFGQNMTQLQPDYGKRQLHRISTALANASVKSNFSLIYLEYVQKRLFSNRALIVVISPLGLHDLHTYNSLRAFGYQILLISPDPISFSIQESPPDNILDLALRTTRIERYAQMKQLMQIGVKVVDWQVHRSLNETLHSIFLPRVSGGFYGWSSFKI